MSPSPAPTPQLGVWFVVNLGLLASVSIVAGLMKAGVEIPFGEVFVVGAMPFFLWGLARRWRASDREQRQAVAEYRAWARSRVKHEPDD